ncbi:MAG TPA: membrane dipeptidase [Bryobacteraceae bacterium]|nr:membrane dipeptidase [Bryobacteraceae bacterium]
MVRESTVIDMLGLLTLDFKKLDTWRTRPASFRLSDFQRLKDSGITVFHPAVGYVEGDIYAQSSADITSWDAFVDAYPQYFIRVCCPTDVARAKAEGKLGIIVGQQNSNHFRTVDDVDAFYKLGQRVSQLTYHDNALGGGSTDPGERGLTTYGEKVLARMNQLGMAVDISHCGDRTTLDVIEASTKPVLVTHSNCRALVPYSARCKTDAAIRRLAAKGGVMGVTMERLFVGTGSMVTIENVLGHIDHIVKLVGVEHVGLGTDVDLDGRDGALAPRKKNDLDGLEYSRKIFELTEGLIRRKYSPADIALILGGNFQRVLTDIWQA